MLFCTTFLLSSCATAPKPPQIAHITFVSMERATIKSWIVMGDYHAESYDEPGYRIHFKSDRHITTERFPSGVNFLSLDFYECDSTARYDTDHVYSARNYFRFSWSEGKIVKTNPDGSFVYEAQLAEGIVRRAKLPICAQVFVNDGNTKRKVWQPAFISNKMELKVPK